LGKCDRTITVRRPLAKRVYKQNKPYPADPQTFGDRFRKHRLDGTFSQPQLAKNLGVSLSTIVKWEGGKTVPPARYHTRIADLLGFNPFAATQTQQRSSLLGI
jgi:DNA-binding XRE family transcriptional regulator